MKGDRLGAWPGHRVRADRHPGVLRGLMADGGGGSARWGSGGNVVMLADRARRTDQSEEVLGTGKKKISRGTTPFEQPQIINTTSFLGGVRLLFSGPSSRRDPGCDRGGGTGTGI